MKYSPIIGAMLDKKTAILDLAFEELPLVAELLENALECLSDVKTLCKGRKEGYHE